MPLIAGQANVISEIDFTLLGHSVQKPIDEAELFMKKYKLLSENETIRQIMATQLEEILNFAEAYRRYDAEAEFREMLSSR